MYALQKTRLKYTLRYNFLQVASIGLVRWITTNHWVSHLELFGTSIWKRVLIKAESVQWRENEAYKSMWKEGINLASKVQFNGFLWVFVRGINFLLFPIAWQSGATSFLTTYVGPITVSLFATFEYCLKKCLNYNTKHSLKIEPQEIMKRY